MAASRPRCSGWPRALALVALVALAGCAKTKPTDTLSSSPNVAVSPATATIEVGGVLLPFTATVASEPTTAVVWQVNGIAGGNTSVGRISQSGVYSSPSAMSGSTTVTITAVSSADTSVVGSAKLTLIADPAGETVSVSPNVADLQAGKSGQTFTATVNNASNTAVTWKVNGSVGGNSAVGTVTAGGHYTPPATAPAQPTVMLTAVSVEDPTKSGSASITITSVAPTARISVSPTSATLALGSGTQTFIASVSNTSSTAVTWKVNGIAGGNAVVGTISATGTYTAPASPPTGGVTVTAVVTAQPSHSASASVQLIVPPPVITGTAPAVTLVGRAYGYTPQASDPNGLPLTFTAAGLPTWATLNPGTGALGGTPGAADVGSSAIMLTVSNGYAQTQTSFTLTVVQTASGSASLSWVAPTLQTDGSPLTDLAGFRVYFSTDPTTLSNRTDVSNSTVTTAVVANLTPGTWYFAVTAIDKQGNESDFSGIATKTL